MLNLIDESIDIKNSKLIITVNQLGLSAIIAAKLLTINNNFEKVGFYFSEYTNQSITILPNKEELRNGELFYNKEKKIVLLNFICNIPSYYQTEFFEELNEFISKNKLTDVIFVTGISSEFLNDAEIKKEYNTPYYITNISLTTNNNTNNNIISSLNKAGIENIVDLFDLKNQPKVHLTSYKEFDELNFMKGIGFLNKYTRYQYKNKKEILIIGAYIRQPLDVEAALSLYKGIVDFYGLSNTNDLVSLLKDAFIEDCNKQFKVRKNYLNKQVEKLSLFGINSEWSNINQTY